MKLVTFNINSIRARLEEFLAFLQLNQPDIVGLQETKTPNFKFPLAELQALGYHCLVHGQKNHYGVALLSKKPVLKYHLGLEFEEDQARIIYAVIDNLGLDTPLHLFNIYFPQGESKHHEVKFPYKREFYHKLTRRLEQDYDLGTEYIAIMGDFNIAPQDQDIGIGEANRLRWLKTGKCSFLPEEREMLAKLCSLGLVDTYRRIHKTETDRFSWFDYRSRGFEDTPKRGLRIDYLLSSAPLDRLCQSASIDYQLRGGFKPSDHCPVLYNFQSD